MARSYRRAIGYTRFTLAVDVCYYCRHKSITVIVARWLLFKVAPAVVRCLIDADGGGYTVYMVRCCCH